VSLRLSGGRRLQSPPGAVARPTASRVRLAVMNLLAPRLGGCRWLDLCCGSGVMACEALQRGAAAVVGVERDRRVAAVALANLELVAASLGAPAAVTVHRREVVQWLGSENPSPFDVIYCDPPYRAGLHGAVAEAVMRAGWLAPEGVLVWECGSDALPSVPPGWLVRDQRRYGGTTLMLLESEQQEQAGGGVTPVGREPQRPASAAEGTAAAVLVPGGHEQPHQGHGDQSQNDAAEEGFNHGQQSDGRSGHNSPTAGASLATHRHQP
jgi:16S rRNA (guanine966-N2)-methyltransferase